MCFASGPRAQTPPPPPAPVAPPPTIADPAVRQATERNRARATLASGRASTMATLGVKTAARWTDKTTKKQQLGE